MDFRHYALLFAGGLLAGTINVMAGGAGFMTFPLLIAAGLTGVEANASNFVALLPANLVGTLAFRRELARVRRHLALRLLLAAAGGAGGSLILIRSGEAAFRSAVPWLLLAATLCFALGPWIKRQLERRHGFEGANWLWLSLLIETIVYAYGGYFGLGMGIVLLSVYALFGIEDIHEANAVRNAAITVVTLIGIALFTGAGLVRWPQSLVMMLGAVAGGWATVKVARRVPQRIVRIAILSWAVVLTMLAFWLYG